MWCGSDWSARVFHSSTESLPRRCFTSCVTTVIARGKGALTLNVAMDRPFACYIPPTCFSLWLHHSLFTDAIFIFLVRVVFSPQRRV
jgi:hypothetical protein